MSNDPRVARILGEWQRARDAGSAPEPAVVIAEHPELAEQLRAGFAMVAALDEVYAHERGVAQTFPSRIGPYALVRELGTGGMGTVYEATVERKVAGFEIGDRVALKVVHPHLLARAGFFKRFLREAEAGRRVRHAKVVSTLDADARETDGRTHLYLVMEYVEGRTLRQLLEDLGVVPEALVREIAAQLAEGLAGIHETGVVHRDLKPDNVIITRDNQIRIMDMGVARVEDARESLTEDGQFAGSLHYAAPEQFDAREVGPAADLYALGVLLYELVTGDNPFRRDDAGATMRAHLQEMPPRADDVQPHVSRFLAELLHTLVAKDSASRFTSASELAYVLAEGELSAWWAAREQAVLKGFPHLPTIPVRRETKLHGREDEFALLLAAWESTKRGEGQTVLVEGEAGIGKSRLLDAFLRDGLDQDVHVLYGSHLPGGGEGAVSGALRSHFGTANLAEALRPYLGETSALVESLAALLRHEPTPAGSPSLGGDALYTALCRLVQGMAAEKPVIWVIEDLHFAPGSDSGALLALARGVIGHRVLLVATARTALPADLRAHLVRTGGFQSTTLGRLGAREVVLLLEEAFHSRKLAERLGGRIARASDGVPFFVFEMIRELRDTQLVRQLPDGSWIATSEIDRIQVPSAVRDLIEARLTDLTIEERALLDVGAVIGFEFEPDLIARVLERSHLVVLQQLARIERRLGVVRGKGVGYQFDHHQIQEVVYGDLHDGLRLEYHTLVAQALAAGEGATSEDRGNTPRQLDYRLAGHYLAGVRPEDALPVLERALAWLRQEYRNEEAVELARHALTMPGLLEELPRIRILRRLAGSTGSLATLGRTAEREDLVSETLQLTEITEDYDLRFGALMDAADLMDIVGRHEEAEAHGLMALELAREARSRLDEGWAQWHVGRVYAKRGDLEAASTALHEARASGEEVGDARLRASAHQGLSYVEERRSDRDAARKHCEACLTLAREAGDRWNEARSLGNLGGLLKTQGDLGGARSRFLDKQAIAREIGHRLMDAEAEHALGIVDMVEGMTPSALERLERARSIYHEVGFTRGEVHVDEAIGGSLVSVDRFAEAAERLARVVSVLREAGDLHALAISLGNLALCRLGMGELESAEEDARACVEACESESNDYALGFVTQTLVMLATERGDFSEAVRQAERSLDIRRIHYPGGVTGSYYWIARAKWLQEDVEGAIDAADEAVRRAGESGDPRVLSLTTAFRASLPGGDYAEALARRADVGDFESTGYAKVVELWLWLASRRPEHLREAKRLLDASLRLVPEAHHDAMRTRLMDNRAILEAWVTSSGDASGAPPPDPDRR